MTIPQAFQIAVQHHQAGRLADAEALYRRILAVQPNHADALHLLGVIAHQAGRNDLAVNLIRQAIALAPNNSAAHCNLGEACRVMGRLEEAIAAYRKALELMPDYAEAHNNLGNALWERGQLDKAVAAYRRALELKPDYPEAHNNLGNALRGGELDEAMVAYRRVLELKPDYPEGMINLGNALKDQGELDDAIAAYRLALRIKPDYVRAHSNLVFALHYRPGQDIRAISEEHERWNRQFSGPPKPFVKPHANERSPERRLRVGYVSPDFRDHPVGGYVLPLLEHHDCEQFEILCYSRVPQPDWITERLRALAGGWRNTVGISDTRLAEIIREDAVDILVDLAMHTADNRLPTFALQPAPVQVSWLAYPGSTGLPSIGYRLTDAHMDPPGEEPASVAEEPMRMPDSWCCYDPAGDSPVVNALPALSAGSVTFGSLNDFAKANEGVLALWARLLDAVKGSRFVILCPKGQTREKALAFFGARGIAAERLELVGSLPRSDYLRRYHQIDLALDPFPCNGMTTTCDALWMGVPVLIPRLRDQAMPVSRAGLSLLSTIGLAELAAPSEEDYVRIAVELAGNLPRLTDLRATLRSRMLASPLMDAPRFARNVETAYRSMWERWCAGQSPLRKE
jgi:protein O-GlcNAc transferase